MHKIANKFNIEFLRGLLCLIDLYKVMQNEQAHKTKTHPINGSINEIIRAAKVPNVINEAIF
jgi:hypothetical protein